MTDEHTEPSGKEHRSPPLYCKPCVIWEDLGLRGGPLRQRVGVRKGLKKELRSRRNSHANYKAPCGMTLPVFNGASVTAGCVRQLDTTHTECNCIFSSSLLPTLGGSQGLNSAQPTTANVSTHRVIAQTLSFRLTFWTQALLHQPGLEFAMSLRITLNS